MQTINEEFTNEEYTVLLARKNYSGLNWHDFIIEASKDWVVCDSDVER
jgi:hypothetical protein